jgi:hypothetical protein
MMVTCVVIPLLLFNSASAVRVHDLMASKVEELNGAKCLRCMGTLPFNTVAVPSAEGRCTPRSVGSWSECLWPTSTDYNNIGGGDFFDFSMASPNDHLNGINDMSDEMKTRTLEHGVEILTDLDDTLICSGGKLPKGIDDDCKGGSFYPGSAEFYYGLSVGNLGTANARKPIPFSARPTEMKKILGMHSCTGVDLHFRKRICGCADKAACRNHSCDCYGIDTKRAQYGKLKDGVDVLTSEVGDMAKMGNRKFKNFLKISPTFDAPAVFMGDNGQGDLLAAQMMLIASQDVWRWETYEFNGKVIAAFIHDVAKVCRTFECRSAWARHNIFMFTSYLDAAETAYELGLLTGSSYEKVKEAFGSIPADEDSSYEDTSDESAELISTNGS